MKATAFALFLLVTPSCAHRTRDPDLVPDRLAEMRQIDRQLGADATEERFAPEAQRQRRQEARQKKAEQQRRVDVVDGRAKKIP